MGEAGGPFRRAGTQSHRRCLGPRRGGPEAQPQRQNETETAEGGSGSLMIRIKRGDCSGLQDAPSAAARSGCRPSCCGQRTPVSRQPARVAARSPCARPTAPRQPPRSPSVPFMQVPPQRGPGPAIRARCGVLSRSGWTGPAGASSPGETDSRPGLSHSHTGLLRSCHLAVLRHPETVTNQSLKRHGSGWDAVRE